jgi:hypothetical protein
MRTNAPLSVAPGTVLGFRKNGRPILPIAGGSEPAPEPVIVVPAVTPPAPPANSAGDKTFTVADLERARKEEKDKLYNELHGTRENLKTLQDEVAKLTQEREAKAAAEQKARDDAEAAARKKFEEEASARELLEQYRQETEARIAQMEQERLQERAFLEKEKEFATIQAYITKRASEEVNKTIAPELIDLISGNTPEQIEASITTLQAKSQAIVESMRQAQLDLRSQQRGVSTAGYAATGPLDNNSGTRSFTAEEIRDMPMAEYAQYRAALMGSASQNQQNRGLFG